jgi:hypothetical protein
MPLPSTPSQQPLSTPLITCSGSHGTTPQSQASPSREWAHSRTRFSAAGVFPRKPAGTERSYGILSRCAADLKCLSFSWATDLNDLE